MKKLLSIILVVAMVSSLALLSSCKERTTKEQFSKSDITVFDTQTVVLGWEETEEKFNSRFDEILELLKKYHKLYDIYYEYDGVNNIKTVNKNAGIAPVKVEREIIDLLLYAKKMYKLTDGMTNVAMGSVLSIWHTYRERASADPANAEIPAMEELQAAALHTDIDKVIIDEENSTVFLSDPDMKVINAYDVLKEKKMYGKVSIGVERTTFIISPEGKIERIMRKVKPDTNALEILESL